MDSQAEGMADGFSSHCAVTVDFPYPAGAEISVMRDADPWSRSAIRDGRSM